MAQYYAKTRREESNEGRAADRAPELLLPSLYRGLIGILFLVWIIRVTVEMLRLLGNVPDGIVEGFIVIGDLMVCIVVAYSLHVSLSILRSRGLFHLLILACALVFIRSFLRLFPQTGAFVGLEPRQLDWLADGTLVFGGEILLVGTFCYLLISLRDSFAQLKHEEQQLRKSAEDQRIIQAALAKRETELRALTETTAAAIFIIQDDCFVYANKRAHEMLGLSLGETDSIRFVDVIDETLREDTAAIVNGILDGSLPKGIYQFVLRSQNLKHRILEAAIAPYQTGGRPALLVTAYDITERKIAENRLIEREEWYRSIIQHSSDIVAVVGDAWNIRYLSPSANRHLGYEPNNNFKERDLREFIHIDDLARGEELLRVAQKCDQRFQTSLFRVRHANGSWRTLDVQISNQLANPSVKGLVLNARDITDRDLIEQQLRQSQKMESVGRLAGGVAHDFNNMLVVILGYTEMALQDIEKNSPAYDSIIQVMKAAERSAELTRQLLAFARKQTAAPQILQLNDTVSGMLKILQRLIGEDLRLVWKPYPALWPVFMDPAQVDQILVNLLVNARDAIRGTGIVTIETENATIDSGNARNHISEQTQEYVLISVSDTGIGMDKATIDQIFEPFFTTKEAGKGTGLGLSTVYGIIKQNGGNVTVFSEPGHGATFRIYLPRHILEPQEAPKPKKTQAIARGAETVLLVEDEAAILKMGKVILEELGYTVLATSSPITALRIKQEHLSKLQLLVTDVIMPGITGRDLAQQMKEMKPDLKCLFISGYSADVIAQRGMLDDSVNFLQKPFSIKEFAERIRKVLDE